MAAPQNFTEQSRSVPRGKEAGPTEKAAISMIKQTSVSGPAADTALTSVREPHFRGGETEGPSWVMLQDEPPACLSPV